MPAPGAPDDPGRVFSWLICETSDDKGNSIVYDYVAEDSSRVDLSMAGERNRIAKEMHDGLSQSLFSTSLEIDVLRKRLKAHPEEAERRLERIQSIIVRSLAELRRYIYDLRPVSLDKLGLVGAIDMRVKEIAETKGIKTRLYSEGEERPLPPGAEACLYRLTQEAIANVAKHAAASSVVIVLKYRAAGVTVIIEDDGHGFNVAEAMRRADLDQGMGLKNMRDRSSFEAVKNRSGALLSTIEP